MAGQDSEESQVDDFILGAQMHSGAQSTLYRVTKHGVDRPLVMKRPRVGPDAPSESVVAFETEAMIAPALTGPHVPVFVATGDLARVPYLVTEWVDGQTLAQTAKAGPLPPAEVARVGAAVADALHSVHQQEAVHLDVKPDNVILRPDGTAVLIDFGFARHARFPDLLGEERRFGAGSAPYVAPEQLLGVRQDRRSDLFALGVVLYELATGRLPFGEPDTDVRNRFWLDPMPPAALVPEIPGWMQEVILRCLEPRPERRYQSAAHVAFDLRHPEQIPLTARATKSTRAGITAHLRRFLQARTEHGPRLRSPAVLSSATPIILAALDTAHVDDDRNRAIRFAVSQILRLSKEFRLIGLTVIPPGASSVDPLVRLRRWAEPLGLPIERLSLHAVPSDVPADVIVDLARHNNVDLVVLGAPPEGGRAWSQSVASSVTPRTGCSVHVVRLPRR